MHQRRAQIGSYPTTCGTHGFMVEAIAVICAAIAAVLFICAHFAVPRKWATVPLGLVFLTIALTIWHIVAGLEPIFTKH